MIVCTFIACTYLNDYIVENYTDWEKIIYSALVGLANNVLILIFTFIYDRICRMACEFENHKHPESLATSYIFKRCFFDFVINYINLFYYAFYLKDLVILSTNFITIILTKNIQFLVVVG
jgi:hypothetical protein